MLKVNSETVITGTNNNTLNTNVNVLLFGYYFDSGLDTRFPVKMKLYSFKLYSSGTIIRNFIPCHSTATVTDVNGVTRPSGTIGLYDLVNDEFYTNANTAVNAAPFIAGPDVNS